MNSEVLERIHDVAISTIKGEVVPGPVGDSADALLATHQVEDVEEEPSKPGKRAP